jgi:acyl carrier protein
MSVEERVKKIVVEQLGVEEGQVTKEASFVPETLSEISARVFYNIMNM